MQHDTISRTALGSPIALGELYDACAEKSCSLSILTESPTSPNYINCIEIPNTESDYVHVKSANDKFHSFNIAAELQISFLAGLVKLSGAGKFLKEENTSSRSVAVSLVHKITTKYEKLSILDSKFRELINVDALKHRNATHVVTGIKWGANLIITVEYKDDEETDTKEIAGSLEAELKTFFVNIHGSASLKIKTLTKVQQSKLRLKIVGDILIPGPLPHTIEGAMALVGELSKLTEECNDGKGVPIHYELTSLEAIKSYFSLANETKHLLYTLQEHTMFRVTEIFKEITEAKLKLKDFCDDVQKFKTNLPLRVRAETKKLKVEAEAAESEFRSKLQTLLVEVRSGNAQAAQLEELGQNYKSGPYSATNIIQKLAVDFHDDHLKVKNLQAFSALGVVIVPGHVRSLSHKLLEYKGKQVYILFGESEAINMDTDLWNDHFAVLRRLIADSEATEDMVFLFVDLDVTPQLEPHNASEGKRKIFLQMFDQHGQCVDKDIYKKLKQETSVCYAKSDHVTKTTVKYNYGSVLETICPESQFHQPHYHKLNCFNCKATIRWDFDEFLYCTCGVARMDSYKFRCPNSKLDDGFLRYPEETFKIALEIARRPRHQILDFFLTKDYKNLIYRRARHMARPLMEAFKNTLDNIRIAKNHGERLNLIDVQDVDLQKKLRIPVSELNVVELETTRIVCASANCIKYRKTKHGVSYCDFPVVCDSPHSWLMYELPSRFQRISNLKEAQEFILDPNVLRCNTCGCPWLVHMPERFNVRPLDGFKDLLLNQDETYMRKDAASKREVALSQLSAHVAQLKKELNIIYGACVGMETLTAISLHGYPISFYLSWLLENLEGNTLMTMEEKKTSLNLLNGFVEYHEHVRAEIALQEDIKRAFGIFGEEYLNDFNKNIEDWYALPLNGNNIKKMANIQDWRWKQNI